MDMQATLESYQMYDGGFGYSDFISDGIFEQQFIDLVRGENPELVPTDAVGSNYSTIIDHHNHYDIDHHDFMFNHINMPPSLPLAQDFLNNTTTSEEEVLFNYALPFLSDDQDIMKGVGVEGRGDCDDEDEDDCEEKVDTSSNVGENNSVETTSSMKKKGIDRSKTLISERKRRGRMKENLYSLRSLVPNITKMDKASIIGDAVSYVQELQMQAKRLKNDIEGLESSLKGAASVSTSASTSTRPSTARFQSFLQTSNKTTQVIPNYKSGIRKIITQMDIFQVEARGFYVRIESNKGDGIAVSLYKALESLTSFDIQNSSFNTSFETSILTSTIHVRDFDQDVNLSTLKIWLSKAVLGQGFEFKVLMS